jgi:hypothetical protein
MWLLSGNERQADTLPHRFTFLSSTQMQLCPWMYFHVKESASDCGYPSAESARHRGEQQNFYLECDVISKHL